MGQITRSKINPPAISKTMMCPVRAALGESESGDPIVVLGGHIEEIDVIVGDFFHDPRDLKKFEKEIKRLRKKLEKAQR